MQLTNINILSTRPIDITLIRNAADQHVSIDVVSFIDIEFIPIKNITDSIEFFLNKKITAVLTSMNAVESLLRLKLSEIEWDIYCIGNTTVELIKANFPKTNISGTANNAAALAKLILNEKNINAIHFFCGDQRREELPSLLNDNGVKVVEHIVYKTIPTPQVVSANYNGILFFSPSAVQSYFSLNKASAHQQYFAIGATTAAAIEQFSIGNVITVNETSKEKLVLHMLEHYKLISSN
jgi:uroporphyrinogen-III synthase